MADDGSAGRGRGQPLKSIITILHHDKDSLARVQAGESPYERLELDQAPTLEWLQGAVGGYIEIVTINLVGIETQCVFNEDGLSLGLPFNLIATGLLSKQVRLPPGGAVGTVVLIQGRMLD